MIPISVAVTTYKRTEHLRKLVASVLRQKGVVFELVIVDDYPQGQGRAGIADLIGKNTNVRYIQNQTNLGYSKNFLKSLLESRGKYIVTLGDDDILIDDLALKRYVDIFEAHPDVSFVYSNVYQLNSKSKLDYVYNFFAKDRLFGNNRYKEIWLKSCFIGGIGLRNNRDFEQLYPQDHMLFPQVLMIGRLLADTKGYGISSFLIGAHAHKDQLGFAAARGERVKSNEQPSHTELRQIVGQLRAELDMEVLSDVELDAFFSYSGALSLPVMKIRVGNSFIMNEMKIMIRERSSNLYNPVYIFFWLLAFFTPSIILDQIRMIAKRILVITRWHEARKTVNKKTAFLAD